MYIDNENRPPITPQLALRVAIIGGVALALFAIVFFRLWYLQVLSGDKYLAQANANQIREIKIAAPRGEIVDRNGDPMVENRVSMAVKIAPNELPPKGSADRKQLFSNLSKVLDLDPGKMSHDVNQQFKLLPFSAATVKQDVDLNVVQYVLEHQDSLPGITIERVFLRSYPEGTTGAHLFGTVGEVNQEELDSKDYQDVTAGDRVGKSGVEQEYDKYLRGVNGASRVQVDAAGHYISTGAPKEPVQGKTLKLAIDLNTQRVGQRALSEFAPTGKGAFVVMDIRNGEILAMGSAPSFDPNQFSRVVTPKQYEALTSDENGAPLLNRATLGTYPTGSTFKLITATAALESGAITADATINDPGEITIGDQKFTNAGGEPNGTVNMVTALQVSSDVYFYALGARMNEAKVDGPLQQWAERYGIGRDTGIDLPPESPGLLPTPEWRNQLFKDGQTDRPWSIGDNVQLAVGQGDLQANPLQMAVAYAALANGGTVVTPHLAEQVEGADGRVLQEIEFPAQRQIPIAPATQATILDGLRKAATQPGGTSYDVFKDFPVPICGKTGTAERPPHGDQSWYIALAPCPGPQYVVAVTIEDGGFGAEAAAPAARQILAAIPTLGVGKKEQSKVVVGNNRTR
ncbi:MAG: penicillin-binding protein 2 [Thermoleophilaceae bacterium]|nr:penicillin-binding protein 2 [Thermoleophilaceae bacterium]